MTPLAKKRPQDMPVLFFAADFMMYERKWTPMEWHLPGRGIGVHILGLWSADSESMWSVPQVISGLRYALASYDRPVRVTSAPHISAVPFHSMDVQLSWSISRPDARISSSLAGTPAVLEVDVPSANPSAGWPTRQMSCSLEPVPFVKITATDSVDAVSLAAIAERLGSWIVIKQMTNLPWWHPRRIRPEFVLLTSPGAAATISKFTASGPAIVQSLVTCSTDQYGHAGELRAYYLCVPRWETGGSL